MNLDTEDCCCICNKNCQIIIVREDLLLLKFIIEDINCKLLQDSFICETCLAKVQQAHEFKKLYLEKSQATVYDLKGKVETNMCEICKNIVDPSDNIPLFDSVIDNGLSLIKYLSIELEPKVSEKSQICEACYKSLLNFYSITKQLSKFDHGNTDNFSEKVEFEQIDLVVDSLDSFKVDLREEINSVSNTMKEEKVGSKDIINYEEFIVKDEPIFFKMENEAELTKQCNSREEKNNMSCSQINASETRTYKCHICSTYETSNIENLNKHFALHKNFPKLPIFKCQICKFQPVCENHLIDHVQIIQSKKEEENPVGTWCEHEPKQKSHLKSETLVHKNVDEAEVKNEVFTCHICKYQTKFKFDLRKHLLTHKPSDIVISKCQTCEHNIKNKSEPVQHTTDQKATVESKIFKCEICEYTTKFESNLKWHICAHDTPTPVFKCQNCEFQTSLESIMKKHIRIHRSKKQKKDPLGTFKCEICGHISKRKSYLKLHMMVHKNDDEVEMFKCQFCVFQTKYYNNLDKHFSNVHKRSNKTYLIKCTKCSFQTKYQNNFNRHNRMFHKSSPEDDLSKCQICGFKTIHKDYLKRHMIIHKSPDEIEMFKCQLCEYEVKYKYYLVRHMKVKHKSQCTMKQVKPQVKIKGRKKAN